MEYGAIDLHKKESQVRIITESGNVIAWRIPTTRDRLTVLFWGRPPARILVEASTESEWVAQHLESLGQEVIVADPNFGLMYGTGADVSKRIEEMWQPSPRRADMGSIIPRIADPPANAPCSGT